MDYRRAQVLSLKGHPFLNERWLQTRIAEDPGLLGLGDLIVKDVERRQPRAGRLDLLLTDQDHSTRYEVEIQLGPTDEAHIIRTLEYWDIERSRYPKYEHVAVIVAEDITSRFLNVISLFNKAIPLIAIQIQALEVGGMLTLNATTVLDQTALGGDDDDDEPGQATDREYWESKGSTQSLALADQLLDIINAVTPGHALKYNKHYVGLAKSGVVDNFVQLRAKKKFILAEFRIPESEELSARLDESGIDVLDYDKRWRRYRVRLADDDLVTFRALLTSLTRTAAGIPEPQSEEAVAD